ncbi:MAG: hypothetical protein WAX67_10485 [Rugosibacter sp.]
MKNWIIKNRGHLVRLLVAGAGLATLAGVVALRPTTNTLADLQAARDSVFAKQNQNQAVGKEMK